MSLEDALYPLLKLYEAAPQPVKSLAGRAYRAIPASLRYGQSYSRFQKEAGEVESWDAQEIRRYQIHALRESLIAAGKAPFYAERFAACGVDPAKFECLEQLADYPLLTKQDLVLHREQMVNPGIDAKQRLYITTGGSSGVPVGFYLHKGVSRPKEQAHLEAMWSRAGYVSGARVAVIRGHTVAGRLPWYFDATRNWLIMSSSRLSTASLDEYLRELNRFRPEFIHAYPSSAMLLARHLEQSSAGLDAGLTALLCGSEHLSEEDKSWLENVFKTRVLRWYGHSERVLLAAETYGSGTFHFCPAYGFVEFGEPDADGLCEIIGTSFHNHVMPLVRYRTGDFARLTDLPVSQKNGRQSVGEIVGRSNEFLIAQDGRRVPVTVVNRHDRAFDSLTAMQFYQETPGELEVRIVPSQDYDPRSLSHVKEKVLERIGAGFQLHFREVSEVERTPRGKQRWLVSRLNHGVRD